MATNAQLAKLLDQVAEAVALLADPTLAQDPGKRDRLAELVEATLPAIEAAYTETEN